MGRKSFSISRRTKIRVGVKRSSLGQTKEQNASPSQPNVPTRAPTFGVETRSTDGSADAVQREERLPQILDDAFRGTRDVRLLFRVDVVPK